MTDLERRVRAGLREYVESVPVTLPPAPALTAVSPATSQAQNRIRRIGLPLLAAAAVIAAVALVPVGLTLRDAAPTTTGDDRPGLPSRFRRTPSSPPIWTAHRSRGPSRCTPSPTTCSRT
jgi:hypothetical protein